MEPKMDDPGMIGEIDFIEDFSLAGNRELPLRQLIPGTRDYYYYHCLHYLNEKRYDEVKNMLKLWVDRHGRDPMVTAIEHRKALLEYSQDPTTSLEYIRYHLGIQFNHEREIHDQKADLPVSLDQKLIDPKVLGKEALSRYDKTTDGFEERALPELLKRKIKPELRRHLLSRLNRPDIENLAEKIVSDLRHPYSEGFGSMNIHGNLTLSQLDQCAGKMPELLNQTRFVNTYLHRLHPCADMDLEKNPKEKRVYLDLLWNFVKKLDLSHNSLKVHVLYHFLYHERLAGEYDKNLFEEYLLLPKHTSYINQDYITDNDYQDYCADLGQDYGSTTLLKPVQNDVTLVNDYLRFFFLKNKDYKTYLTYINDIYLKELFAETMIIHNLGDMEKWYSMIPPSRYQALKERVDIDFDTTNKRLFSVDEEVKLRLNIKNVETLFIKIFQINTLNYYRDHQKEINTDIDLDGLIPNEDMVETYTANPLHTITREFAFPDLTKRGVYIIEFIGNGKSSRALIRKGHLTLHERISVAGHVFTVVNENNEIQKEASINLGGHEFKSTKEGEITVPYSAGSQRMPIVIQQGDFSCLDHFLHLAERYFLKCGMHVDRETLIRFRKAKVLLRPSLTLNHVPVTLKILENPTLSILTEDHNNIQTYAEVRGFKFHADKEPVHEFMVPDRLYRITFKLTAWVKMISSNERIKLEVEENITVNEIDQTDTTEDLHLTQFGDEYVLDLFGKSGEPQKGRPIQIRLKHHDFVDEVYVSLQTDSKGRVFLGEMVGIERITASGPQGNEKNWHLRGDQCRYANVIHAPSNEPIYLPYMGRDRKISRQKLSLIEIRNNQFYKDWFELIQIKDGFIIIDGLLPGDYDCLIKPDMASIKIRVAGKNSNQEPVRTRGYIMNQTRHLETTATKPIQIESIEDDSGQIKISLAHSHDKVRVHVIASRYVSDDSIFQKMTSHDRAIPKSIKTLSKKSVYISGRDIGDEYRYILERKYSKKYPGNLLKRPELLLNPWSVGKTETRRQDAHAGDEWEAAESEAGELMAKGAAEPATPETVAGKFFSSLDFLSESAVVLENLKPDPKGVILLDRKEMREMPQICIIAMAPENVVCRRFSSIRQITPSPITRDLRLINGLSPESHYTEQNNVSVVSGKEKFVLENLVTSRFEIYDTLSKVFRLYMSISNNDILSEFSFILSWPEMTSKEKHEKYSRYACHELNFFIYKKDKDFFLKTVFPYILNKKDKTFLDHYLLEHEKGSKSTKTPPRVLSAYLKPWQHGRLNIVEKILLAKHLKNHQGPTQRYTQDLLNLLPPDTEHDNFLFMTALKGSSLDVAGTYAPEESSMAYLGEEAESYGAPPGPEIMAKRSGRAPMAAPAPTQKEKMMGTMEMEMLDDMGGGDFDEAIDLRRRDEIRQLYRKTDKTEEFAENNYFHIPILDQNENRVTVNAFWRDYASHDDNGDFFSIHFPQATSNFTEMMFAVSILDIPFQANEVELNYTDISLNLTTQSPLIVFHKEVMEAREVDQKSSVFVSQNFFRQSDRYDYENGVQVDKYVTEEFLVNVVYGSQVVVTNPTSRHQKLEVLMEIPQGSVPVLSSHYTQTAHMDLAAFNTQTIEYHFYFPLPGVFNHYPVHVSKEGHLIAYEKPFQFNVVKKATKVDKTTWDYLSQHGSDEEVLEFLNTRNINRINLDRMAWRMKNKNYYHQTIDLLKKRYIYHSTLWSYSIRHNDTKQIREFLKHSDSFVEQAGPYIDCDIVTIDPVIRKTYQHLEYSPLINARIHRLGNRRKILNNRFHNQYHNLMKVLSCRNELDDDDMMAVTYYLLLQDRIEEAYDFFNRVDYENLHTLLQYDYFSLYFAYYKGDFDTVGSIANTYQDYPVKRWREIFEAAAMHVEEIKDATGERDDIHTIAGKRDHAEHQMHLATTEPAFDFKIEAGKITLNYHMIAQVRVNYYQMDIELLFSRNPFMREDSGRFSHIQPSHTQEIQLHQEESTHTFDLPESSKADNIMVEIMGQGIRKSQNHYANSLNILLIENYGQVRVLHEEVKKPLAGVYVKVFARFNDGQIRFYKDGYTDPRGRFEYASLSTDELDHVDRFSILILSDTDGATVSEAAPPKA